MNLQNAAATSHDGAVQAALRFEKEAGASRRSNINSRREQVLKEYVVFNRSPYVDHLVCCCWTGVLHRQSRAE